MQRNKKILFQEWIKRAKDDELNILSVLKHRDGTPALVCFMSHQVAEKYLKAFLLLRSGDFPKTHSLLKLLALAKKYLPVITEELENRVILLNPYYIEARYPTDIPLESFSWKMAEDAYRAANKVKKFVLEKI
jgi:HEPN domain-containing protein